MTGQDRREREAAVRHLESRYDDPNAFSVLHNSGWAHTPDGMASVRDDHRRDCYCETDGGEIWTQADTAAKWEA